MSNANKAPELFLFSARKISNGFPARRRDGAFFMYTRYSAEVRSDIKVRRCRVSSHRKLIKDTGSVGGDTGPLFAQGMGND